MDHDTSRESVAREVECLCTIGAIAGRVAHEINNPLAGVHNSFRLVKDAIPQSHPHFAYVAAIERQIQRIAAVTRRFADTYSAEADSAVGVAVSAIVGGAVQMAVQAIGTGTPPVEILNAVHLPFPQAAGLLRHVLIPGFGAAIRAADPATSVTIDTRIPSGVLIVEVRYLAILSSHPPELDAHAQRLLAALGGTTELHTEGAQMTVLQVRIPFDRVAGETS
jgi:signal transduction histidine kinase